MAFCWASLPNRAGWWPRKHHSRPQGGGCRCSQGRAASTLPATCNYTVRGMTSDQRWRSWHQSMVDGEICTILCREGPDEQGDVLKGTVEGQKGRQIHGNDRGFAQSAPKLRFFYPYSNLQDRFPMSTTRHLADLLSTSRYPPFFLLFCTSGSRFKPHRSQPLPRNVKVVLLQRKGVLFLPVPVRQAGSCLLRTQIPSGAEPQLPLWI